MRSFDTSARWGSVLPRKGVAHAICVLSHAAVLKRRTDLEEWVRAASRLSTSFSAALDLRPPAEWLLETGLAAAADCIVLTPALRALPGRADRVTLLAIAGLMLRASPPGWLPIAVGASGIAREYIPTRDLEALLWIDPELDHLMMEIGAQVAVARENAIRERVGAAAELLLLAAFERAGRSPIHVAKLSDAYGYDIEMGGASLDRVEVKAAGPGTRGRFRLSRNEFEKSQIYRSQWRLVQVVFAASAFAANRIGPSHVDAILQLKDGVLGSMIPTDPPGFVWKESAELTPLEERWRAAEIELDPAFTTVGFR